MCWKLILGTIYKFNLMMVQICCRERERRLGGGEGNNSGMCVAGCWIGVSCEEEMRIYFDLNDRH